ncbi:MAG: MATE family efflux transporter [Nanoarchaeota archaeon]
MNAADRVEQFKKHPERSLITLALPIILGMLVQVAYNFTDTAFVGRLGVEALAAVTFSFPVFFMLIALSNMIGLGASVLISQAIGAKNPAKAGKIAKNAVVMSVILALVSMTLGLLFQRQLFDLLGAEASVIDLSIQYMTPLLLGTVLLSLGSTFGAILNGQGDTRTPAIIQVISAVSNVIMDYVFIFVFGWGVAGAAIATAAAFGISVVLFSIVLARHHLPVRGPMERATQKSILSIGVPAGVAQLIMSVSWLFLNFLFAKSGTVAVAAYGIMARVDSVVFMPLFGIGASLGTLVGMFYGAKEFPLISRVVKSALKYSLSFSLVMSALIWIFPRVILSILTTDAEALRLAVSFMRIEVFVYPLMAIGFMLGRTMMSLGTSTPFLVTTIIRSLAVTIPLAWVLIGLGYGPISIIVSIVVAGAVSLGVSIVWYMKMMTKTRHALSTG